MVLSGLSEAELSQLLEPNVLSFTVVMFVNVANWLIISVAPRPAFSDCEWPDCDLMNDLWGAGSWYNFWMNPYLTAVIAVLTAGTAIYALFAPARVTSACQRVAEAVNACVERLAEAVVADNAAQRRELEAEAALRHDEEGLRVDAELR